VTSTYLDPGEYAAYGLPSSATAAQVQTASSLIDQFTKRPEGLLWTADATGNPLYMTGLSPSQTFTADQTVTPGSSVTVPVSGPINLLQQGDTLILDRANAEVAEAVTVIATSAGAVILKAVANAHASGSLLEGGLTIVEQKFLPGMRPITTLSRNPVARITSCSGRYGYGRRGDAGGSNINEFNLLAALSQFGGPPVWEVFDPLNTDVDSRTGQTWIPAGIMLAYYTEVKIRYLAGFTTATLPDTIKQACAMLVQAVANSPNLGAVKSYKAGDTQIVRWADTMISGDVRSMLLPFQVRAFA
jgi:hypothetical protein